MINPTVSVLMPVYHGDNLPHLELALDSVLKQTLQPDQILIVVDGPIDADIMSYLEKKEISHQSIDILRLPKNLGLPNALNTSLEFIKSDWVARFDADDIMVSDRLEVQVDFIKSNDLDVLGGQIREFDEIGNYLERTVPVGLQAIKKMLPWRNPLNHVTVMYRSSLIKRYKYRDIKGYEDYDLWMRLLSGPNVKISNIPNILVEVRAGSRMYSRRVGITYALNELNFRVATSKYSKSFIRHWASGILRSTISLFPQKTKAMVYLFFLRKKANR